MPERPSPGLSIKCESFREALHQLCECNGLFVEVEEGEPAGALDRPVSITVSWSRPGAERFTLHAVTEFGDFTPFEVARSVAERMREVERRCDGESRPR